MILTLNLKACYWFAIRDGQKEFEFRRVTPYWEKRLLGKNYSEIHICLGYPKRTDSLRRFARKWTGEPGTVKLRHAHFGKKFVTVFAIRVSEFISQ